MLVRSVLFLNICLRIIRMLTCSRPPILTLQLVIAAIIVAMKLSIKATYLWIKTIGSDFLVLFNRNSVHHHITIDHTWFSFNYHRQMLFYEEENVRLSLFEGAKDGSIRSSFWTVQQRGSDGNEISRHKQRVFDLSKGCLYWGDCQTVDSSTVLSCFWRRMSARGKWSVLI